MNKKMNNKWRLFYSCLLSFAMGISTMLPVYATEKISNKNIQDIKEYDIMPNPQELTMGTEKVELTKEISVNISSGISDRVKNRSIEVFKKYGYTLLFDDNENDATLSLSIYNPNEKPDGIDSSLMDKVDEGALNEENHYDAHVIKVSNSDNNKAAITLCGETDDAVFYGLSTLDQILEQSENGYLYTVDIKDSSDTQLRGVVEGYYGYPFKKKDIISLMNYGENYKMNAFVYGPKTDAYHLGKWRESYPTEATITNEEREVGVLTQEEIRDIVKESKKTGVEFIWAISPMFYNPAMDLEYPEQLPQAVADIMAKYEEMYDLGVRQFGLFLDDIPNLRSIAGHGDLIAQLVEDTYDALVEKYGKYEDDYVNGIKPLIYVPTVYFLGMNIDGQDGQYTKAAKETLKSLRDADLGNPEPGLDPDIIVSFTGSSVFCAISDDSAETMYNTYIGRKPLLWWNMPVHDIMDDNIFIGPMNQYMGVSSNTKNNRGFVGNPMSLAEASKIYLYAQLDYGWNSSLSDFEQEWEDAIHSMFKDDEKLAESFFIFAKHSGGRSVRTDYSGASQLVDALKNQGEITTENARPLMNNMKEWSDACDYLIKTLSSSDNQNYKNLFEELSPWIYLSKAIPDTTTDSLNAALQYDEALLEKAKKTYDTLGNTDAAHNIQNPDVTGVDPKFVVHYLDGQGDKYQKKQIAASIGNPRVVVDAIPRWIELAEKAIENKPDLPSKDVPMSVLTNLEDTDTLEVNYTGSSYEVTGLSGKILKPGDYVGLTFGKTPMLSEISEISVPNGLELQYSENGSYWHTVSDLHFINPSISALRIINLSKDEVVYTGDVISVSVSNKEYNEPKKTNPYLMSGVSAVEGEASNICDKDWSTSVVLNTFGQYKGIAVGGLSGTNISNVRIVLPEEGLTQDAALVIYPKGEIISSFKKSEIKPETVVKDGKTYQVYTLYNLYINNASELRFWGISGNESNIPLEICEIEINSISTDKSLIKTASGTDASMAIDANSKSAFIPTENKEDYIDYQIVKPENPIKVVMHIDLGNADIPKVEVKSNNEWKDVPLTSPEEGIYEMNVSSIKNLTNIRINWDKSNVPKAIYDISYETIPYEKVDLHDLVLVYLEAKDAKQSDYPDVWEELQREIENAKKLINGEASSEEINNEIKAIKQLLSPTSDALEKLKVLINECEQLEIEDYTNTSWQVFDEALTVAKTITENNTLEEINNAYDVLKAAEEALVKRASEQLLEVLSEKVAAAEALKDDYTEEEFKGVQAAIDAAKALLANPEEAGSMDAVNALTTLQKAVSELSSKPSADKLREDLEETVKYVKENVLNNTEGLRPGKVQELKDAIAEAEELLANPEATADELSASLTKVTEKVQELWEIVNKDELNALIETAKAIKAEGYTEESYNALQEAIKAAEKVAANDDATTTEVKEAISSVAEAIANLEKEAVLDKTALEKEISLVEKMVANIDDYVASTVKGLEDKLNEAKDVLANATTQEEIDEAVKMLREARLNARVKADKEALKEAIETAKKYDLSKYTKASAQALRNAMSNAEKVMKDEAATQEEVDAAVKALDKSMKKLVLNANVAGEDEETSVKTGVTSQAGAFAGMLAVAGGAAITIALKKKKEDEE